MNRFIIRMANMSIQKQVPKFYFSRSKLDDKEQGEEHIYFTKEDQKLIRKLAKKLEDIVEDEPVSLKQQDKTQLKGILSRYKVPTNDALVEELVRWKDED